CVRWRQRETERDPADPGEGLADVGLLRNRQQMNSAPVTTSCQPLPIPVNRHRIKAPGRGKERPRRLHRKSCRAADKNVKPADQIDRREYRTVLERVTELTRVEMVV